MSILTSSSISDEDCGDKLKFTSWTKSKPTFSAWVGNRRNKNRKFWETLISYFPVIRHGSHRKRHLQHFFVAAGTSLLSCYLTTIEGYIDSPRDTSANNSCILECVFVVAVTFLLSRRVATIAGIRIKTHRLMGGINEVRHSVGSDAMTYIPSFTDIGSATEKSIWWDS
jgi:hypothetical protein